MLALETAPNGAGICVCVFKRIKKKYFKKQRLAICSPSSSLSSRFNSPTEVKEMTSGGEGERQSSGQGQRRRREQVDSLINNHKVRQAVPS